MERIVPEARDGSLIQYGLPPLEDGQSEVTIRVLENFLRSYVERNPHTWVQQLPLTEFAANNTVSINTEFTPFYLNTGAHLTTLVSMLHGGTPKGSQNKAMKETLKWMKTALVKAQTNLERAQCSMANTVNRSRRSEQYNISDEVVLSTMNLRNYYPNLQPNFGLCGLDPSQ